MTGSAFALVVIILVAVTLGVTGALRPEPPADRDRALRPLPPRPSGLAGQVAAAACLVFVAAVLFGGWR